MKFILGKKLEMTRIFDEKGNVVPVTLIEAGPCFITQIKTKEDRNVRTTGRGGPESKNDGYEAIQIGFIKKTKKIKKTEKGKEFKYLKEVKLIEQGTHNIKQPASVPASEKATVGEKVTAGKELKVGDEIKVDIFKEGDIIKVSGISKGKGFQGVVKRWGFGGRPTTHGTKHEVRTPGSVGCRYPQRVIKGRRLPGRMGGERVTVKNLKIVKIDKENNLIAVKGAVPGNRGSLVEIRA